MKNEKTQKVKINAMVHSNTAAALYMSLKLQTPKAMARTTSRRIKVSLIQKEERRMRCSRYSV